jgi:hypothetical protein
MQQFAWQGFELKLPPDWECVKFSRNRAKGECGLADRHGPRMSVFWSAVRPGANVEIIVKELVRHVKKSGGKNAEVAEWQVPMPWRGFVMKGEEELAVAVAQFPESGFLAKLQFVRRKNDNQHEIPILKSLRWQDARRPWRWCAFGCRVTLPSEFLLKECEVLPGRATLTFGTSGWKAARVRVQRLAMPETFLKGRKLSDWYAGTLPDGYKIEASQDGTVRGHAAAKIDSKVRLKPWQTLLRHRRTSKAYVWICEREARMYCAEFEASAGALMPDIEQTVECA